MLPHLDYSDTSWGDQPGLTLEMQQLQAFQNRFAKEDRRCQIARGVSRGPDIVEMVSMEGALDVDVL